MHEPSFVCTLFNGLTPDSLLYSRPRGSPNPKGSRDRYPHLSM
jgi:hypothetical protein